jgi:hypothetical protein
MKMRKLRRKMFDNMGRRDRIHKISFYRGAQMGQLS